MGSCAPLATFALRVSVGELESVSGPGSWPLRLARDVALAVRLAAVRLDTEASNFGYEDARQGVWGPLTGRVWRVEQFRGGSSIGRGCVRNAEVEGSTPFRSTRAAR